MKHPKYGAMALCAAAALGLLSFQALADGAATPTADSSDPPLLISPAPAPPAVPEQEPTLELPEPQVPGSSRFVNYEPVNTQLPPEGYGIPPKPLDPDPAGFVSFENLEARVLEHSLTVQFINTSIESVDAIDYDELKDQLRNGIRMLESQSGSMKAQMFSLSYAIDDLTEALDALDPEGTIPSLSTIANSVSILSDAILVYPAATVQSLEANISSMEDSLQDLKDGIPQKQAALGRHQLRDARSQVVMGAQTMYLTLLGLEQTMDGLDRQLAALDRTLAELELRHSFGQISALALAEVKAGRVGLISGMETLEVNMTALRRQLESFLGEEITGTISLMPIRAVSQEQLDALDPEADLQQAMSAAYELHAARQSLEDARNKVDELYPDLTVPDSQLESAELAEEAAEINLKAAQQGYELKFLALYEKLLNQQQVLNAARTSLAVKENSYAVAQLKYQQGTISHNALLETADTLAEARTTVDTEAINLFTYYNNYLWAVETGILN